MQATLTTKGQVTIPKAIREQLRLRTGDQLEFLLEADGVARIVPITRSVQTLKGMVPAPKRRLSLEEMDEAIAKGATRG